jgi:hypothetical protein
MALQQVLIKKYEGKQENAYYDFKKDAEKLALQGYVPTTQNWAPGSWGCGSFILALILCFILIGILIFIYMLLVKPAGILSVTYELQNPVKQTPEEKTCPKCAEQVKLAATVCRFCGHNFE